MKVWITKYALTSGIFTAEADMAGATTPTVMYELPGRFSRQYARGKSWHRTEAAAIKRAEEMRLKKLASLRKLIKKLEALEFKAAEVPA